MTRKKRDYTREVLPDPVFGDVLVSKTVNTLMRHGKKSVAEAALYDAFEIVKQRTKTEDTISYFRKAIDNIKPMAEVRSRRVGGATYQVPTEVRPARAQALALRWLTIAANSRTENGIADRLAGEIMDAFENRGLAIKKREDIHKMAEANRAFAHFKWN